MNWLEIGQRVEGLIEDIEADKVNETEYPKTAEVVLEKLRKIIELMDEPID